MPSFREKKIAIHILHTIYNLKFLFFSRKTSNPFLQTLTMSFSKKNNKNVKVCKKGLNVQKLFPNEMKFLAQIFLTSEYLCNAYKFNYMYHLCSIVGKSAKWSREKAPFILRYAFF